MSDLERREVTCPTCGGSGNFSDNPRIQAEFGDLVCLRCNGAKVIPEPAKAWAARVVEIARKATADLAEAHDSIGKFQDFACGVSDVVWGGELGWDRPDGLNNLLKSVRNITKKLAAMTEAKEKAEHDLDMLNKRVAAYSAETMQIVGDACERAEKAEVALEAKGHHKVVWNLDRLKDTLRRYYHYGKFKNLDEAIASCTTETRYLEHPNDHLTPEERKAWGMT